MSSPIKEAILDGKVNMKVVDVSIEFDFFCPEEADRDWQHSEHQEIYKNLVWLIRYTCSDFDLFEETDFDTHADFLPQNFLNAIENKNIGIDKRFNRVYVCDSHQQAYRFFKTAAEPEFLINIDAHHDLYNKGRNVSCDNWLTWLVDRWHNTQFVHLYPRWKRICEDAPATRDIQMCHWKHWQGLSDYAMSSSAVAQSGHHLISMLIL